MFRRTAVFDHMLRRKGGFGLMFGSKERGLQESLLDSLREELVQTVPSFAEQFSARIFFSKGNLQSEL